MKLQNPKKIFASNSEKRTQKQAQKGMNEMERHKNKVFDIFRKGHA